MPGTSAAWCAPLRFICSLADRLRSSGRGLRPRPNLPASSFLRDRAELYRRINERVEMMFAHGVVDEVRAARNRADRREDTRIASDSRFARGPHFRSGMHRLHSARDSALREKTIDLVSATN